MVDWMRDAEHETLETKSSETSLGASAMTDPNDLLEERDELYARLNSIEERYEDVAEALGVVLTYPNKQHDEIMARARECKGAYDYFHSKPASDLW